MPAAGYVGRFAPSPTGPLHFGSLVAAVGSYLQARRAQGRWLLRIEDIDRPRVVPGAADRIIRTLAQFGFEWDGAIEYQSLRAERYAAALSQLQSRGLTFACSCSRAQIAAQRDSLPEADAAIDADEPRYSGLCRHGPREPAQPLAIRLRVAPGTIEFEDALQGHIVQDISAAVGDFVIKRRDGLHAYHLAVVVDDAEQGITEVARGADLLTSTPRQILLQRSLSLPTPSYCHLPLAMDRDGRKLSKASQSIAIDSARANECLWQALAFLRQAPPLELRTATVRDLWDWALDHWDPTPLRGQLRQLAPT